MTDGKNPLDDALEDQKRQQMTDELLEAMKSENRGAHMEFCCFSLDRSKGAISGCHSFETMDKIIGFLGYVRDDLVIRRAEMQAAESKVPENLIRLAKPGDLPN